MSAILTKCDVEDVGCLFPPFFSPFASIFLNMMAGSNVLFMTPYYTNRNVAMDIRVICTEIYSSLDDVYSWT